MAPGLQIQILWSDDDLVEVRVRGSNGVFSGGADAYVGHGEINEAATALAGFPRDVADIREVTFGAFGPEWAAGAVRLRFSCVDPAGHCAVDAVFEADPQRSPRDPGPDTARFRVEFEVAAFDRFVAALGRLESDEKGTTATLEGLANDQV